MYTYENAFCLGRFQGERKFLKGKRTNQRGIKEELSNKVRLIDNRIILIKSWQWAQYNEAMATSIIRTNSSYFFRYAKKISFKGGPMVQHRKLVLIAVLSTYVSYCCPIFQVSSQTLRWTMLSETQSLSLILSHLITLVSRHKLSRVSGPLLIQCGHGEQFFTWSWWFVCAKHSKLCLRVCLRRT